MRYFDAMRSEACPVSLTAHQTQHKTCKQHKNAIVWADIDPDIANDIVWAQSSSVFAILHAVY